MSKEKSYAEKFENCIGKVVIWQMLFRQTLGIVNQALLSHEEDILLSYLGTL